MNEININFLGTEPSLVPPLDEPSGKKHWPRYVLTAAIILALFGLAVFAATEFFSSAEPTAVGQETPGFFTQLKNLILSGDRQLKGESEDRVNILLLGIGGEGHDGAYLTDTIILASIKTSTRQVALLSIPRDLLVEIPNYGFRRINEANSFGELQAPGAGSRLAKETLEKVLGLPIHYYLQIDFAGFKKMIDEVGGVDVYVDKAFEDVKFPTDNHKYRTISFAQGWQKMDGQTALDFARSRHGNNGEGNDFARSRRQQKVLKALKDKIFSLSTLFNLNRLQNLFEQLNQHIQANVELRDLSHGYKLAKKLDYENLVSRVLAAGENEPLMESQFGSASVLMPRSGNFEEIQRLARNLFSLSPLVQTPPSQPPTAAPPANQPGIQILNGTWILGLAAETKVNLEQKGLAIETVGNAKIRNYEQTVIYDYSNGHFPEVLNHLKTELAATVHSNPPAGLLDSPPPDILVILGKDQTIK